MEWNELRKEARKLESDIELKLVSYSKLSSSYASALDTNKSPTDGSPNTTSIYQISHSMSVEIEQLLANVSHFPG